jgi:hypothetical protein
MAHAMSKKSDYTASQDLFIRRLYTYMGVGVIVEIDLLQKTVSMVERMGNQTTFQPKKWVFAGRELEYMTGWKIIIAAMNYAVEEATKELEAIKDRDEKQFLQMLIDLEDFPKSKGKKK